MPRILFVGFGISSNRTEAVSINIDREIKNLKKKSKFVKKINVGFESKKIHSSILTMAIALVRHGQVTNKIAEAIKKNKITHVYDTFVLPGASVIFTLPLKKIFPKVTFVKEIHNNYGFSKKFTFESAIRFLLNTKSQVKEVVRGFDKVISRNKYISEKFNIIYVPTSISISSLKRKRGKKLRLCFLGHPLQKKGLYKFYHLMSIIPDNIKENIQFTFAFSDITSSEAVIKKLRSLATIYGVTIDFCGKVEPNVFFRAQDILLLPLEDEYSSAGSLNSVLEAMEAGCLVVTTKTHISEAFIRNNKNGMLMSKSTPEAMLDIILKIATNRIDMKPFVDRARADIMVNHSGKSTAKILEKIYG